MDRTRLRRNATYDSSRCEMRIVRRRTVPSCIAPRMYERLNRPPQKAEAIWRLNLSGGGDRKGHEYKIGGTLDASRGGQHVTRQPCFICSTSWSSADRLEIA